MKQLNLCCFLTSLALLTPGLLLEGSELKGSRPNIILVMTDDQGKGDLSCLGNKILKTPHLDRLHALSTRFRDFHVSPTCAPTRSAIMTGRHEFKNGVTHTILERERMTLKATTLAESLRDAGYATGIFGKWHLGDEEPYQPHNRGFTETFIHGAGGIGQSYPCSCGDAPPNQKNRYFDNTIRHNGKFVQTKGFCTDVFFDAALGWIKSKNNSDQPFFVYITPNAPHGPMIAPDQYKNRFLNLGFDEKSSGRMGMIENIDDNMGRLTSKLKEWDLEETTLLIFMTDNGQAGRTGKKNGKTVSLDSSGFKTGKGSPYEGGTRVPSFWRWKGVLPEGKDMDALTAHIDLFPTFAALANSALPEDNQIRGRSLLPLLKNPDTSWEDRFLFVHQGRWKKGTDPDKSKYKSCAVRTERFRLVNNRELYDINADPFEQHNVIINHPEVVAKMRKAYDTWWTETLPLMVNEKTPNSPTRPFDLLYENQLRETGIPLWNKSGL
ncbi:MAG TPA: arylsulfatase [Verrucomicrobiales bacterium]|nr:arylsulfatase [Verrucomicrobiales bacterium]